MNAQHAHGAHGGHDAPHLPHGSIWPFWLAIGASLVGIGLIFKEALGGLLLPILSVPLLVAFVGWFREDHRWWWTNTGTGVHVPRAGTLLFIGSEVFLFGGLFATYFTMQHAAGGVWPDPNSHGHTVHLPLATVAIFSLFLFASSATIHMAEHHLKRGDHKAFTRWWGATILLGLIFLGGQVSEYLTLIHEEQTLAGGSQFMTMFFMITGTHGLHVLGGLIVLIVLWIRAMKGQFSPERHAGPESAALYWHFVDLVWVIVLTVLYILPTFT